MKRLALVAAALLLTGCAATSGEEASTTTAPSRTTEAAPTATPSAVPTMPSRADMDPAMRTIAEAFYLDRLRSTYGITITDDTRLVGAGDAACDSMDRGDSNQAMFIVVAALLPDLESTDQAVSVAAVASGVLCPEHAPK